jgi:hypothetical protein
VSDETKIDEPAEGALVAFGPLGEIEDVFQRCSTAALESGAPVGEHWFRIGDDGAPLSWGALPHCRRPDHGPHLLALSAPSEPVPDGPRVWAMPELPEDVSAVRDRDGWRWERVGEIWRIPGEVEGDRFTRTARFTWVAERDLLELRSPLTEVVEEAP